ncbi:putative protein pbn1 [Chiua virens]|nr:putative protein pbn1 [Chiua virens]
MSSTVISHSLQPDRGFHSTLSTTVALDPPRPDCSFFALYAFLQSIIIDRYELVDRHLSFEVWGEPNLELPVFALDQSADSLLLINVTLPDADAKHVTLDIPVHTRYGEPGMAQTPFQSIAISTPTCFWACPPSAGVSASFSSEPPVSSSSMLGAFTQFSIPSASSHYALLQVPVASKHDLFSVEIGTAAVTLITFIWLVYRCWRVALILQSCHLKQQ